MTDRQKLDAIRYLVESSSELFLDGINYEILDILNRTRRA